MRFVSRQDFSLCDDFFSESLEHSIEFNYASPIHSAVPIVSRMSLPSAAGTARLFDFLPPSLLQRYSVPFLLESCVLLPLAVGLGPASCVNPLLNISILLAVFIAL